MGGEVVFEEFGEFGSGRRVDCGEHVRPTSSAWTANL
jgi:hypothetical protein